MVQAAYQAQMRILADTPFNIAPHRRVLAGLDATQVDSPTQQLQLIMISSEERISILRSTRAALNEAIQAWLQACLQADSEGPLASDAVLPAADFGMHRLTLPGAGGTTAPQAEPSLYVYGLLESQDFTSLGVPERSPFERPQFD